MAVTLQQLLAQKAELERQIEETHAAGRSESLAQIKALMDEAGLTIADLQSSGAMPRKRATSDKPSKPGPSAGQKVAPKYRDPGSGNTWSGRGLKPKWLSSAIADGKKVEDFAI